MTPEEHYREAEQYVREATRLIAQAKPQPAFASFDREKSISRIMQLANLHREMAETGLAFEKPDVLATDQDVAPGGSPAETMDRTSGPGYDVPTPMWAAIRTELVKQMVLAGWSEPAAFRSVEPDTPNKVERRFTAAVGTSREHLPGGAVSIFVDHDNWGAPVHRNADPGPCSARLFEQGDFQGIELHDSDGILAERVWAR